jgi:hypothetical protein
MFDIGGLMMMEAMVIFLDILLSYQEPTLLNWSKCLCFKCSCVVSVKRTSEV